jgi:hypothetical protein
LNLSAPRTGKNGVNPQPGIAGNDGTGNRLTLHVYNSTMYRFLRLTVDKNSILCEFLGVDETTNKRISLDAFTLDMTKNVVATKGAMQARTRTGDVISPESPKALMTEKAKKKK